jgi:DNA modification methylase
MRQFRQLPLFTDSQTIFRGRSVKSVTFKGNFDYPIHRWFRLTPSFSPELVADIMAHWNLPSNAEVLEPFCGVGTTPLVCQERGLSSCAVELNPLLHFVARVKTTPYDDPNDLPTIVQKVLSLAREHLESTRAMDTETFQVEYHAAIPAIRDATKWWSPPVLRKITALRLVLAALPLSSDTANLLKFAVVSILIEVSNARHNHPSLSFAKTPRKDAPVFERFEEQVMTMKRDLLGFPRSRPETVVLLGNSKQLKVLPSGYLCDAVITSPPYPNRYSYARETRPQMFYLGLVKSGREVGQLEVEAIGGTWGKATSVLEYGVEYRSPAVEEALRGIPELIGQHGHLMQNYVIKYFNNIEEHVESLRRFLRPGARLAYVIGNSKFYGVTLPADEILADIFETAGFQITSIERMRRRNSKSGLYEAIVFMEY